MADWFDCVLTVVGDREPLANFKINARGSPTFYLGSQPTQEDLSFDKLYPVPKKLRETYYNEESYHWEINHWGCKWGPRLIKIIEEADDSIAYSFVVPGIPLKWLVKVSEDYPSLIFYLDIDDIGEVIVEDSLILYK